MNDDQVDHSRRHLLTAATAGIGAVGVVFAAVPFISSWQPSAARKSARRAGDRRCLEARRRPDVEGRVARPAGVHRPQEQGRGRGARESRRSAWPIRIRTTRCSRTTSRMRDRRGRAIPNTGWASRCARTSVARRSARSSRTTPFRWRAPIWDRIGRAGSIAPATARSTTSPDGYSRACRRRRICRFPRTLSRAMHAS